MYLSTEAVRIIHEERVAEAQKLANLRSFEEQPKRFAWFTNLLHRSTARRKTATSQLRRVNT